MANLIDLAEAQKKMHASNDTLQAWLSYDEKGNLKVSTNKLAYEIMKDVPMIRTREIAEGARFDPQRGAWVLGDLDDFLERYITDELEKVGKWSQQKLNEVKRFIMIKIYDSQIHRNPFDDSKPYLVNFQNGTYNMLTGEMKSHDVNDYILQTQNYAIDPMSDAVPSHTLAMLKDLTGDEASAQYLTELTGYCFYRSYVPFQCITILQGSGGNGKSTFLNLLSDVLGQDNVSNITLQDLGNKQNRFASSNLYQKNANLFADIDDEFLTSTGMLKALTGGDWIAAEKKGKDAFMFVNFAKLIFSGNELPPFSDFTAGFERRLYVVPFPYMINDRFKAKHDLQKVREEIPVFALYSMRAFQQAMKRKQLAESQAMKQVKQKWLRESNHVLRFIEEMCIIDKEEVEGDASRTVYEKYRDYCFKENLKELSQPRFTKQLAKLGIAKVKQSVRGVRVWRYRHLRLKAQGDE